MQVSAYTANMATFLISDGKPVAQLESIDEARMKGLPICVTKGMATGQMVRALYKSPSLNLVEVRQDYGGKTTSYDSLAQALRDDLCDAAILTLFEAQELTVTNKLCDMELFGGTLVRSGAGFASKAASWTGCSVVSQAFQVLQQKKADEGVMPTLFEDYLAAISKAQCTRQGRRNGNRRASDSASSPGGTTDSKQLRAYDMAGSFCVHGLVLIMCLTSRTIRILVDQRNPSNNCEPGECTDDEITNSSGVDGAIMNALIRMEAKIDEIRYSHCLSPKSCTLVPQLLPKLYTCATAAALLQ